jgi:hypothetical protein
MNRLAATLLALTALVLPAAAMAGHSELAVPPAQTFLLGGDQAAAMQVTGRNTGKTEVTILARTGEVETTIAAVAPGTSFVHTFIPGETALIRNASATETARLSVDFTGSPESLSMSYSAAAKK